MRPLCFPLARYAPLLTASLLAAAAVRAAPLEILDSEQSFGLFDGARAVAASPDGRNVYLCAQLASTITSFAVNRTTGELTRQETNTEVDVEPRGLTTCQDIAISPDGAFVYTAAVFGNAIGVYGRNPETGALTWAYTVIASASISPFKLAISPGGEHLYASGIQSDSIIAFERDAVTGDLTQVDEETETPAPDALLDPNDVIVSADGRFVHTLTTGPPQNIVDSLITFSRDATSGEIAFFDIERDASEDVEDMAFPNGLAASGDGRNLYVSANESDAIVAFARSPVDDTLSFLDATTDAQPGVVALNGPTAVVVSPDGAWVAATTDVDSSVVLFARDRSTGLLTFADYVTSGGTEGKYLGRQLVDLAIDPRGRFLYAASFLDDSITVLAPEPGAAATTLIGAMAVAALAGRRSRAR